MMPDRVHGGHPLPKSDRIEYHGGFPPTNLGRYPLTLLHCVQWG